MGAIWHEDDGLPAVREVLYPADASVGRFVVGPPTHV